MEGHTERPHHASRQSISFTVSREYHYTSPLPQWLLHHSLHLMSHSGSFCQIHGDEFPAGGGAGEGRGRYVHDKIRIIVSVCTA